MKYLLLLFLLLALALSQTPNCKVRDGRALEKVYVSLNETQAFSFSDYFTGFNLYYHATAAEKTSEVIQNIKETSKIVIQNVPDNYTSVDFDIYSDGNGAWMDRASSLGFSSEGYYVRYGYLTEQLNVNFSETVKLELDGMQICYDVATVSDRMIMVDCFNSKSGKDTFYLFDETNKKFSSFEFDNRVITTKRKTIPYHITGNRTYLISATIASGVVDQANFNKTFVRFYQLDLTNNITQLKQADSATFELPGLAITDISVDAIENIYLTDANGNLLQFTFDGKDVTVGGKWNLAPALYKVSVYITPNLVQIIQVVTESSVIEIDLDDQKRSYTYELPEGAGKKAIDFQSNERLVVVLTDDYYYIYERYVTGLNEMLALYERSGTLFALSPRSPNIIIAGIAATRSLVSSRGFLLVNNVQDTNQTIVITAASQNPDGENPICTVEFLVTSVGKQNKVYAKRDFNASDTAENPAYETYVLDQYFLGSKLTYEPQPGKGTTLNLQYISNITISSDTQSLSELNWFATFSYDMASYYRLSQKNNQMTIQNCVYDGDVINCKTTKTFEFKQKIIYYAFYLTTIDLKSNIPIFAYVIESDPHSINIWQINSDKNYNSISVNDQFNITDIDANERFIYATVKDAHIVYVFKNDLSSYDIDFTIDESFIKIDHPVFYPRETILSPNDINVLAILNLNSLIIMRMTAFSHEYITSIYLPQLETASAECKVTISRQTLLIFIRSASQADEILEYGIYDIYNPVLMRNVEIEGKALAPNLVVAGINEGNIVAVRTVDLGGDVYLTMLRTGQPKVGAVLTDVKIGNVALANLVSLSDSAVLEIFSKTNMNAGDRDNLKQQYGVQDSSYVTKRYYFRPILNVRAHLDQGFKSNFSFGLTVSTSSDSQQVTKTLTVYNVKSKIEPSGKQHELVTLPDNTNSAEPIIRQIYPDPLFVGPISQYRIQCPICNKDIKLWDHVYGIGASDALIGVKAYYFFEDKNRLWALSDSKIHITDGALTYVTSVAFDFANNSITAQNWFVDGNGNIQVLFSNGTDDNQFFLEVTPSDDKNSATVKTPVVLSKNPGVKGALLIKSAGNRIFIQDAKLIDSTANKVHVYTWSNSTGANTVTYETTIDFSTFGQLADNGINDFELVAGANNQVHFIATLGNIGFAWFTFDKTDTEFVVNQPNTYNLTLNPEIWNNLIDTNNNYLQLEFTSAEIRDTTFKTQALLTVDNGQHFQLNIEFAVSQQGLTFTSLNIITTFGKYGKEKVLNWAQRVSYKDHGQNLFLIGHQGDNNVVSLSVYDLQYNNSADVQQAIGAAVYTASKPLTNNLVAQLFRDGNNLKLVESIYSEGVASAKLYNLSKQVYLSYKYEEIKEDFNDIKIFALNNYGEVERAIPVKVNRPDNTGGIAWYFIVIIIVGALVVVGLIVFLVIRQKRKGKAKDSLLSTSKNESDQEV